ncbi:MBL fold metallo-hydrolase [Corynebacterium mendelii]|uniref:MBL fold metallo-hydrolase n=1 Tax=Corynebacterium mendelii TaxID=2765362 RepID=UPI002ED23212
MTVTSLRRFIRAARGPVALVVAVGLLAACAGTPVGEAGDSPADGKSTQKTTAAADPLEMAKTENRSRSVDPRFGQTPQVVADSDYSGIEASQLFFTSSETVVVSGPTVSEQLRAASLAVASHAPVIRFTGQNFSRVNAEIDRLAATVVLVVGNVPDPVGENLTLIRDPGTFKAIGQMTARQFDRFEVDRLDRAVAAVAGLDPKQPVLLSAGFETMPVFRATPGTSGDQQVTPQGRSSITSTGAEDSPLKRLTDPAATSGGSRDGEGADNKKDPTDVDVAAFPAQSARDGGTSPIVVCSPLSGIPAVATAKAWGAEVRFMDYHDPRFNDHTRDTVAGLADKPLVALGQQFGTANDLSERILLADSAAQQLPGGGGLVFPGRRMIAFYGHPSGPALGVMGEQPPQEAVDRLSELVADYQGLERQPVIPAFEIIATVASAGPGADGNYSTATDPADIIPWIDAITAAGGYAIVDLQPGRARLLDQAKLYENLLLRPNVGLALDPEWKLGPDQVPLQQVGHATAAEINEVAGWLADLVKDHKLPQKALVLHQFQMQMIRDREQLDLSRPELAWVLHADGHGHPAQKFSTWNVLRQGLDPRFFMAWKNFIDEDSPTFTPEETYAVNPRPWFVSYQ